MKKLIILVSVFLSLSLNTSQAMESACLVDETNGETLFETDENPLVQILYSKFEQDPELVQNLKADFQEALNRNNGAGNSEHPKFIYTMIRQLLQLGYSCDDLSSAKGKRLFFEFLSVILLPCDGKSCDSEQLIEIQRSLGGIINEFDDCLKTLKKIKEIGTVIVVKGKLFSYFKNGKPVNLEL